MRASRFYFATLKEAPAEAEVTSQKLMLRAGLIKKVSSGIYTWMPLGLVTLRKVEAAVREEMNRAGAIEIYMPHVVPAELWQETGRWEKFGPQLLKIRDRHERDFLFGPTHEEVVTDIVRKDIRSYRQLPVNLYQIQVKFRDEIRPRFGVMRGREFLMKDAYSFDIDYAGARRAYNKMFVSYLRTYARMGLKAIPMAADTGPIGGDLSHEFIILADTGESQVYCHKDLIERDVLALEVDYEGDLEPIVQSWTNVYAATDEKHDPARYASIPQDRRAEARGIEVGHIFHFGTKYSEPLGAKVSGPNGEMTYVQMGSYGIGVSRLVGAIIEASHDDAGIIWPESVAPFHVGLVNLKVTDAAAARFCDDIYARLRRANIEVLYDDRDERAGAKFATMDLIGLPWQLVVGPRGLASGTVELKRRATGEKQELSLDSALSKLGL
jgi:prolyl-tRNA synthetase